jgi:hypothetical protein
VQYDKKSSMSKAESAHQFASVAAGRAAAMVHSWAARLPELPALPQCVANIVQCGEQVQLRAATGGDTDDQFQTIVQEGVLFLNTIVDFCMTMPGVQGVNLADKQAAVEALRRQWASQDLASQVILQQALDAARTRAESMPVEHMLQFEAEVVQPCQVLGEKIHAVMTMLQDPVLQTLDLLQRVHAEPRLHEHPRRALKAAQDRAVHEPLESVDVFVREAIKPALKALEAVRDMHTPVRTDRRSVVKAPPRLPDAADAFASDRRGLLFAQVSRALAASSAAAQGSSSGRAVVLVAQAHRMLAAAAAQGDRGDAGEWEAQLQRVATLLANARDLAAAFSRLPPVSAVRLANAGAGSFGCFFMPGFIVGPDQHVRLLEDSGSKVMSQSHWAVFEKEIHLSKTITDTVDPDGEFTTAFVDAGMIDPDSDVSTEACEPLKSVQASGSALYVTYLFAGQPVRLTPFRLYDLAHNTARLCRGLQLLHAAGITHLDTSLANVLIKREGPGLKQVWRLIDFGLPFREIVGGTFVIRGTGLDIAVARWVRAQRTMTGAMLRKKELDAVVAAHVADPLREECAAAWRAEVEYFQYKQIKDFEAAIEKQYDVSCLGSFLHACQRRIERRDADSNLHYMRGMEELLAAMRHPNIDKRHTAADAARHAQELLPLLRS